MTVTPGGTTDDATGDATETGSGDSSESAGSDDEDGCQSAQPSSLFALLTLLMVLYFQRREKAKPVKVR